MKPTRELATGMVAALAACLLMFWLAASLAAQEKGDAGWIQRDHPTCCGHDDCFKYDPGALRRRDGGLVFPFRGKEYEVAWARVRPSRDGFYWACFVPNDDPYAQPYGADSTSSEPWFLLCAFGPGEQS